MLYLPRQIIVASAVRRSRDFKGPVLRRSWISTRNAKVAPDPVWLF